MTRRDTKNGLIFVVYSERGVALYKNLISLNFEKVSKIREPYKNISDPKNEIRIRVLLSQRPKLGKAIEEEEEDEVKKGVEIS